MDVPRKSESEQLEFFEQCRGKFLEAVANTVEIRHYFRIGEMKVCLSFAGETLVPVLTPALEHLRITDPVAPDATIYIWDSESTAVKMVKPPCDWDCFTDRGDIWGFTSKRIKTAFHWGEFSVNVFDLDTNTGVFWVETVRKVPYWVYSSPLRTMIHWLMESVGCQLLHAAAVGIQGAAVLISGKGGMGKSSTSLICLEHGFQFLGDDYVIVKAKPSPVVFSLYSTAKVNTSDIAKFPAFAPVIQAMKTEGQEKLVMQLYPRFEHQIKKVLPLKFILTPRIKDQENTTLSPVSRQQLTRAMALTTMSQLPYTGEKTMTYIGTICDSVPAYLLELGSHREEIPGIIRNLLLDKAVFSTRKSSSRDLLHRPLISVIIPVFNGENFIEEAIGNVLSQNYPALEIIVVDDGSTDRSAEIIKSLPVEIRYLYQENDGPASARNRGIRDASGEYIAFLDVDDLWPVNNLNELMDRFLEHPEHDLVRGYAQLLEKNESTGSYDYAGNPKETFPGYIGAGLYRKTVFNDVGLFDEFMKFGEDADWFKRALELNAAILKIEEVTLFVRRHEGNMTRGKSLVELNALKVFKKSLDRLREPRIDKTVSSQTSVIIPVYNAGKYLVEAIESVLNQSVNPLEIIIVNDGSTDNSLEEIGKFGAKVKLISQENLGAASARNKGIKAAQGKYLAFADADDLWTEDHLEILSSAMRKDAELEMALGMVEQFISPELGAESAPHVREDLKVLPGYHAGAMLIKRSSFDKVGNLNESLVIGELIDWFDRARQLNIKTKLIDRVVYKRRIHTTNMGLTQRDHLKDYTSVLREVLKRRRGKED